MNLIETLVRLIINNKDVPRVQVEREISPILEIFLESVMDRLAERGKIPKGKYRLLAPEFPIQSIDGNNENKKTTSIDYLMLNISEKKLFFVELKTNSTSFRYIQFKTYQESIKEINKNGAGALFEFLKFLTQKNKKYETYKTEVGKMMPEAEWKSIKEAELIYLAPKKMGRLNKRRSTENQEAIRKIKFIFFGDLHTNNDIDHEFSDDWKMITHHLRELDSN